MGTVPTMLLESGDRLLMIGDSVTDGGRARPVGEGLFDAIGNSYVRIVDGWLGTAHGQLQVRVQNLGSSGNTVRDLEARWQDDVIDLEPDWVTVLIGINDVWRQFDLPRQPENHVLLPEYEATLDRLVAQTKPKVKGMLLGTPFYIEPLRADPMRACMDEYGEAVRRVAAKHGVPVVDVQAEIDGLLQFQHSAAIAWDRVHPNHLGHMAIARAFLRALGAL